MLLVAYDISNDKLRTRFSKMLEKFGYRLQYSLFEIKNSSRMLEFIKAQIVKDFEAHFEQTDSILIFHLSKTCKVTRYGYAKNDESDFKLIEPE